MRNLKLTTIIFAAVFAIAFVGCGSSSEKAGKAGLFPFGDAAGKTGYVRLDGKVVVEPKFVYGHVFLDTKGNVAVEPIYKEVAWFSDGLAAVEKDKHWGFIDTKGIKYMRRNS